MWYQQRLSSNKLSVKWAKRLETPATLDRSEPAGRLFKDVGDATHCVERVRIKVQFLLGKLGNDLTSGHDVKTLRRYRMGYAALS